MRFNKDQTDTLSKYLADLSKIIFASTVVGFFVPSALEPVATPTFVGGILATVSCLAFSIKLLK
ncbi:MAG: hypothetical protein AAB642_00055 [Patescibacteria group bacterium]